jgi:hypothetical protein
MKSVKASKNFDFEFSAMSHAKICKTINEYTVQQATI